MPAQLLQQREQRPDADGLAVRVDPAAARGAGGDAAHAGASGLRGRPLAALHGDAAAAGGLGEAQHAATQRGARLPVRRQGRRQGLGAGAC